MMLPYGLLLGFLVAGGTLVWGLSKRQLLTSFVPARARATALVSLGDSLGVGLSPHLAAWAVQHGLTFVEDTKVGRRTPQQATDLVPAGALVFVSLGTNDAVSASGAAALPQFAANLRARNPRAIVWLVPPATKALAGLAAVRDTIKGLPGVIPVWTSAPMRADGLHPSSYSAVMANVAPALTQALG